MYVAYPGAIPGDGDKSGVGDPTENCREGGAAAGK